ncbi:hypothetical protein PFY12_09900 [Chryseobacterium camelliae]|uniref:SprT-like domain-containing protein n=1 Tax=Chryseobacterium camelliae TaxID=1265445 RepID=A0ABY7QJQ9_9FLAO|nr:hypothetical protein [Chryseobacterium camelliae]WBV59369.1 hypothetical protein PFY12_09900 [Chryseobacterium camelliae]
MNFEQIKLHLNAYKENDQIIDAAKYLLYSFDMEHENFAGFGFREPSPNLVLLTTEGELGDPQTVIIPSNLFDFDLNLVLNVIAHEMLHVRQKAPGKTIEDKNEREFQAYYEMLFHKNFPKIPDASDFHKKIFGEKAFEYYKRMGEGSDLQQKYATQKVEIEQLISVLP